MENNNDIQSTPSVPAKKSKIPFIVLGVILIVGAILGIRYWIHSMNYTSTDNAQIETNNIPVLSRINGFIDSVFVKDYQEVKKGDLLFVIDKRELEIAVHQAEADLMTSKADLVNAQAQLNNSKQNQNVFSSSAGVQEVRLQKAESDYKRDQALYNDQAITKKQLEDSKANYEAAQKLYTSNNEQTRLAGTQTTAVGAQIAKAESMIKLREAMLEQAVLRLSYTRITAPISGRVNKVILQAGQYIQPGQNLLTIVDNTNFWIVANFKETQIADLKEGQEVNIHIDGYKKEEVKGKITAFSDATGAKFALLPPDNATGNFVKITQRIPVRIDFDNLENIRPILKAGMSVDVEVKVK
jgi:membrane fusion protein (multidrug efflux system)